MESIYKIKKAKAKKDLIGCVELLLWTLQNEKEPKKETQQKILKLTQLAEQI